jgi:hypothetical protein
MQKAASLLPSWAAVLSSFASPGRAEAKAAAIALSLPTAKAAAPFFLLGFAKSERENIDPKQLADLKMAAADILNRSDHALDMEIEEGRLQEVYYDQED